MAGMAQFHWDPATYRALMRAEVPAYDELQDAVAGATRAVAIRRVLDLGTGTGETAGPGAGPARRRLPGGGGRE